MIRIAIIGAGFSGLAVSWHLLNEAPEGSIRLTLFDEKGIGGGASGIATGLLHPYGGAHAKLNRLGLEGLKETRHLLKIAGESLKKPVAENQAILRLALTQQQTLDFTLSASKYPTDIEWLSEKQCQELYPYLTKAPGIWIKDSKIVLSRNYLMGLWKACETRGAILEQSSISSLKEVESFDVVVVAAGANSLLFSEFSSYGLTVIKGQLLELEWPSDIPSIPFALNSQAYLILDTKTNKCLVGSSYEKNFRDGEIEMQKAKEEILPKVIAMLPFLAGAKIIGCYAGLRVATPNHMPLTERVGSKLWLMTGMGSKGLLYHALQGKKLALEILSVV